MTNLEIAREFLQTHFADIKYRVNFGDIQSPEMLMASKIGQCWEQAELARFLFESKNIPCKTYFIDNNFGKSGEPWPNYQTHTFLVFTDNGKFYWFEHSWEPFAGIHEYNSLAELLADVRDKHIAFYEAERKIPAKDFRIREYENPKLPITGERFLWHCINSKQVEI